MPTKKQKRIKKRLDRRQSKVDESRATFGTNDPDLGKFDRRLNRLKRTVSQAEEQGMNVNYDTRNASGEGAVKTTKIYSSLKKGSEMTPETRSRLSSDKYKAPTQMESAKQERKNLLDINPIAKHASGSWMSKHSKSAFQMGHSPVEMGHDSPAKHKGSGYGTKHEEEVSHGDGTGMHSHAYGRQRKQDEGKERSEKRKKVKATIKAGKAIAKSM